MSRSAIEVEGLGKKYLLGEREGYRALRDVLSEGMRHPLKTLASALRRPTPGEERAVWALRNVSFSLAEGETLGVVGMNGSGKTTLLRLLTRITEPTEGRAVIRGRVSSLLEVGTGFHPELSGRENIFVNGVMLGMERSEVRRRQNDIIEFSGIGPFIDTPVKRYSSGMQLRLAFSVAAHLEPDIVLIDEVLAVGDVAFQTRCIKKMQEMARVGRTIVYVSHNLPSVSSICDRAIILNKGQIVSDGPAHQVVDNYVKLAFSDVEKRDRAEAFTKASLTGAARLLEVTVEQEGVKGVEQAVDIAKAMRVNIEYEVVEEGRSFFAGIHLYDQQGTPLLSSGDLRGLSSSSAPTYGNTPHRKGRYLAACEIPANFLNDKRYYINAHISELPDTTHVFLEKAISFDVSDTGEMRQLYFGGDWLGCIRPKLSWNTSPLA